MVFPIDLVKPALDAITRAAAAAAQGNSAQGNPTEAGQASPPGNGELSPGSAGQLGAGPAPETSTPEPVQDRLSSMPESDED